VDIRSVEALRGGSLGKGFGGLEPLRAKLDNESAPKKVSELLFVKLFLEDKETVR
jgi:hypothetical protein